MLGDRTVRRFVGDKELGLPALRETQTRSFSLTSPERLRAADNLRSLRPC